MEIGERIHPASAAAWRAWLEQHHGARKDIWLIVPKKGAATPGVSYAAAVEEALCFGWIDSQMRGVNDQVYALRFTPRRRGSTWAASTRSLAARLIAEGRMAPAGLAVLPTDL
jgi:uncharacterized protein YdeI (YjbR/CyaY-like superfamily)